MTASRLHEIVTADNKNPDGTSMMPDALYNQSLYMQLRDLMVSRVQNTATFAGVQAYDRVVGEHGVVYTMLMFSTMDSLLAYENASATDPALAQYRMVRDQMLELTKVQLTTNAPVETTMTSDQLKALTESEILDLLTAP
jgi:hypothetical protein